METIKADKIDKIKDWLTFNKRSIAWLASETKIPYNSLYAILIQRNFKLSEERELLIEKACKKQF